MQMSAKNSSMHVIKIICQNKFDWERLLVDATGKKKHNNYYEKLSLLQMAALQLANLFGVIITNSMKYISISL